ncbi:hypothetical protein NQZ79_g6104 [Umbelopsis isabellina]|nr:hypothetical protein NQZ79_g6104 [Umbelopsis isabellina]
MDHSHDSFKKNREDSRLCEQHDVLKQEFSHGTKFPSFDFSEAIEKLNRWFKIDFQPVVTDITTYRLDVGNLLRQIETRHQNYMGDEFRAYQFSEDLDTHRVVAVVYPMVMCIENISNSDACKLIEALIITEWLSRHNDHDAWNDIISSLPGWFRAPIDFEVEGIRMRMLAMPTSFPATVFDKDLFEDMAMTRRDVTIQHIFLLAAFQGAGEYTSYCPSSGLRILNKYALLIYVDACRDEHVKLSFHGDGSKVAQSMADGNCLCSYGRRKYHNLVRMRVYKREKDAALSIYTKAYRPYQEMNNVSQWTSEAVYIRSPLLLIVVWFALILSFVWPIMLEFACGGLLSARNIDTVGCIFASLAVAAALPQVLSSLFQLGGDWKHLLVGRYIPRDTKPFAACCKLCMLQRFVDSSSPTSMISGENACFILGAVGHTKLHCEYTVGDLLCLGMNILECTTGNRRTFATIDDPQACYVVEAGYNWGSLHVTSRKSIERGRFITFPDRDLPVRGH